MNRPAETDDPHFAVGLSLKRINSLIAKRVTKIEPQPIKLGGLGRFKNAIGNLSIAPKRLQLVPTSPGHVGVKATFDIRQKGSPIFDVTFRTDIEPILDTEKGTMRIELKASDFKSVKADLSPKAADRVTNILWKKVPKGLKLLGKKNVKRAARKAVSSLSSQAYNFVKGPLAAHLGTLARIEVAMPPFPIAELSVRTNRYSGGILEVGARTSLGVQDGLESNGAEMKSKKTQALVRFSGNAFATLGNWFLREGMIQTHYTSKGKPDDKGAYTPAFDWVHGDDRPLKVHVYKNKGECIHARIGGRPTLAMAEKGKVKVGVEGGEIERVDGPALIEIAGWAYSLWADAIEISKDITAQTRVKIAGTRYQLGLSEAEVFNDEVILGLRVEEAPKGKSSAPKASAPQYAPGDWMARRCE